MGTSYVCTMWGCGTLYIHNVNTDEWFSVGGVAFDNCQKCDSGSRINANGHEQQCMQLKPNHYETTGSRCMNQ